MKRKTIKDYEQDALEAGQMLASMTNQLEANEKRDYQKCQDITIALGKHQSPEAGAGAIGLRHTFSPAEYTSTRPTSDEPLSWAQIFVEIGRLREIKARVQYEDRMQDLIQRGMHAVERLERFVEEEDGPEASPHRRNY